MLVVDVDHFPAAGEHGIRDQRAMASPGDGFGAHDRGWLFFRDRFETLDGCGEFRCLHVVGIAAEHRVSPAEVDGVRVVFSSAAKVAEGEIVDPFGGEGFGEIVGVEVRESAGTGVLADVGDGADFVGLKDFEEFRPGVSGVADGEERWGGHARF